MRTYSLKTDEGIVLEAFGVYRKQLLEEDVHLQESKKGLHEVHFAATLTALLVLKVARKLCQCDFLLQLWTLNQQELNIIISVHDTLAGSLCQHLLTSRESFNATCESSTTTV